MTLALAIWAELLRWFGFEKTKGPEPLPNLESEPPVVRMTANVSTMPSWKEVPYLGSDHMQIVEMAERVFPEDESWGRGDQSVNRHNWLLAVHRLRSGELKRRWHRDILIRKERVEQPAASPKIVSFSKERSNWSFQTGKDKR